MIRSVTCAMVGCRVISLSSGLAGSIVPACAVAFGQSDRRGGPPGASAVRARRHALARPGGANLIDPDPLCLDLVPADEQGRVALDEVQQQPLVGDPAAKLAEGIGQPDIERDFAKPNAATVQPRSL